MHRLREQQYPATRTDCVHGRPDEAVACYRENRRVSASAFSLLPHRSDYLGARSVNVFPQAECFRYCKPLRIQIGSNYAGPGALSQYTQQDTNWPLTYYQNRFTLLELQSFNSLHASVYRLHETGLLKGDSEIGRASCREREEI